MQLCRLTDRIPRLSVRPTVGPSVSPSVTPLLFGLLGMTYVVHSAFYLILTDSVAFVLAEVTLLNVDYDMAERGLRHG